MKAWDKRDFHISQAFFGIYASYGRRMVGPSTHNIQGIGAFLKLKTCNLTVEGNPQKN